MTKIEGIIISEDEFNRLKAIETAFNENKAYVNIYYPMGYPRYSLIGAKELLNVFEKERQSFIDSKNKAIDKRIELSHKLKKLENRTFFQRLFNL